jgi:hypothetical protein
VEIFKLTNLTDDQVMAAQFKLADAYADVERSAAAVRHYADRLAEQASSADTVHWITQQLPDPVATLQAAVAKAKLLEEAQTELFFSLGVPRGECLAYVAHCKRLSAMLCRTVRTLLYNPDQTV